MPEWVILATIGAGVAATQMEQPWGIKPKKGKKFQLPGQEVISEVSEIPGVTVEEIEAQEMGWQQILKRARGRKGTILTEPMLAQLQPYTQRATLLAG